MLCPVDANVELVMSERQGVEIDYCPTCRGVWLDRGELDKILDRAASMTAPAASPAPPMQPPPPPVPSSPAARPGGGSLPYGDRDRFDRSDRDRFDRSDRDRFDRDRPGYKKKRKESWLGDLLDFG